MNEIKGRLIETSLLESFRLTGKYTKTEAINIMENVFERNPFFALMLIPLSGSDHSTDDALLEIFSNAYIQTNGDLSLLNDVLIAESIAIQNGDKNIINEMLKSVEGKDILPVFESEGDTLVGHVRQSVSDAADDINKTSKGIAHTVGTKYRDVKRAISKSDNPIIMQLRKWYEWATHYDNAEEKREAVITGSAFIRLRRIYGKYLLYYTLRPAIIAALPGGFMLKLIISIVTWVASTVDLFKETAVPTVTNSDPNYEKARNQVIQELELELKMAREKIEDARSANNVKAKYELMRVENKIEAEIARIKYGSKR